MTKAQIDNLKKIAGLIEECCKTVDEVPDVDNFSIVNALIDVRDLVHARLETVPETCPKCNSESFSKVHTAESGYLPECYFKECENCGHQWDQG